LTITGTNFPKFIDDNTVSITLSDTAATIGPIQCKPMSSSSTKLTCQTRPFGLSALTKDMNIAITINTVVVTNTLTAKIKTLNKDITSMIPNNASPVLKSKVIFTIMTGFPFTINKDDFTVNFTLT